MKKLPDKKVEIRFVFDDKDSAQNFVAAWLDGGLDGGGNCDIDTCSKESDDWTKNSPPEWLRIKGTCRFLDETDL